MKRKLKDMVEEVLRNQPETRNSDITLTIEIWRRYYPSKLITRAADGQEYVSVKALYDLPREDNVKRIRALFNAEGKYYPTDWVVAKHRGINEDAWRQDLGYPAKGDTRQPTRRDSYMDPERDFTSGQGKLI